MTCSLIYTCDTCGKEDRLVAEPMPRGGSLYGKEIEYLLPAGTSFHACSDTCLIKLFESWAQKIRYRQAVKPPPTEDSPGPRRGYGG